MIEAFFCKQKFNTSGAVVGRSSLVVCEPSSSRIDWAESRILQKGFATGHRLPTNDWLAAGWRKPYNKYDSMSPQTDDLTGMKDDMTAFIEGQGMRRFFGYVECEEVPSVLWDSAQNPDGWKDFVELAKSTGAPFLTMHSWALDREELERLSQQLADSDYRSEEDMEESRWLKTYVGKTGFVQLGWAYQGCVFVYEAGTEWYARYQQLRELADDSGGFMIDEPDQDEER
jgi:hypothetical protein